MAFKSLYVFHQFDIEQLKEEKTTYSKTPSILYQVKLSAIRVTINHIPEKPDLEIVQYN